MQSILFEKKCLFRCLRAVCSFVHVAEDISVMDLRLFCTWLFVMWFHVVNGMLMLDAD